MIDPPSIAQRPASAAAVVPLVIPRAEMARHFGPAVAELMAVLRAQDVALGGPVVAHHLRMTPDAFDLEVGVAVAAAVAPSGRVVPRDWPERTVATTIHHGPYEELHAAWAALMGWLAEHGHRPAPDLYETYLTDPAGVTDPGQYRTRLERPLA